MTFRDYYKHYVSHHQDPRNRRMHVIGNVATLVYIVWIISIACYWWLLAAPFVVYVFAFPGHWVFEKNQPALTLRYWLHAKTCDIVMCYRILRGLPIELDDGDIR